MSFLYHILYTVRYTVNYIKMEIIAMTKIIYVFTRNKIKQKSA